MTPWERNHARKVRERSRMMAALRLAGLNRSYFTKKRTIARQKNFNEAVRKLSPEQRKRVLAVWG